MKNRKKNSNASESELLGRALAGDRIAMIEFAMAHCDSRLRRRVDGQLRRAGIRIVDSDDVIDSAGRRLLLRCEKTGMIFSDCGHIVAYITEMVMNLTREKIRAERSRARTLERLRRDVARRSNAAANMPAEAVIESLLSRLTGDERRMVDLRLGGMKHVQIAAAISLPLHTYRDRWRVVQSRAKLLFTVA